MTISELYIKSITDGPLGCLQFVAITNSATPNTIIHVLLMHKIIHCLGYLSESVILNYKYVYLQLTRKYQIFYQSACISYSPTRIKSFHCSISTPILDIILSKKCSQSSGYKGVSHCVKLHFFFQIISEVVAFLYLLNI